jgi:hypothetical protein
MKHVNAICLIIWIINFISTIINIAHGEPVSPIVCLAALAICILHYIEELFE